MSIAYQFSLDANVTNPDALFQAAMTKAQQKGGLSYDEALKLFKPGGKLISTEACLVEMLDPGEIPGCQIQNSGADHVADDLLVDVAPSR